MDMNQLRKERTQAWHDTIRGKDPKRVPHYGNLWLTWMSYDAGYTLREAMENYEVAEKCVLHAAKNYKLDFAVDSGWRNPLKVLGSLGADSYQINDADHSLNVKDRCYMEPEDYDALIANPKKWLWEVLLPRKFKYLQNKGTNLDSFRNYLQETGKFGAHLGKIGSILAQEYGWCSLFPQGAAYDALGHGLELLFCSLRGIEGMSLDIRRIPDKVEAAIEALNETFLFPRVEKAKEKFGKGTSEDYCVDINLVTFAHTIMNHKQFERFYWPYFQMFIKYVEEFDKIGYFFAEGDSTRFHDFYRQLPANRFGVLFDLDDIYQAKKNCPNLTIAGGIRASMLGTATPQQCVDEVKRVMDAVAYDKKFIFAEHTMISFPKDCKPENLRAVCDYIDGFRY